MHTLLRSLIAPLLACAGACAPQALDPIVTSSSNTSADTTSTGLGPSSTDPPTTASSDAPQTGGTVADTTEGAPDGSSTGTSDDDPSTTEPVDTSSTGGTDGTGDDTGAGMLDPCPLAGPMSIDLEVTTPNGPVTLVTGVFHWETGLEHYLVVQLFVEPLPASWDFDTSGLEFVSFLIKGFDGPDPQVWFGEQETLFWHHVPGGGPPPLDHQPLTVTEDTLDVWSLDWADYDSGPILGGTVDVATQLWDVHGSFVVPYCHPMSYEF